ncbi:GntR family transcriptional regulator [Microbacterium sp. M3]|uniref:GntR family transcriptional regulator n=1 Tax=Microbacterium arthrosphaerae TaxID=792652 RepID=A0ABU4H3G2_9MICO|nr:MULTISPECIES: GntR family transcriptional regulator [Microbacterium]MDW4572449.1 GntR family transcriptional regulator [Microbacterium arthrosphaerae]MDW7606304.1 GntR family transcriptional regulator [Microbacterium sp. M3]
MSAHPVLSPADDGSPTMDIYRQLRGLIVSGQLGANERLPTVRQTASDLGVAPGTAAKAYKMLEQDGLVVTRTAAGTRVAESAARLPLAVTRQIRELVTAAEAAGATPDDVIDVLRVTWRTTAGAGFAESKKV